MSFIFAALYNLFAAGSKAGATIEDMGYKKDVRYLPNGMKYWMDRKGCLRDMNNRKISVENSWDKDRLIVRDIMSQRVIYDAKTANMTNYKQQLIDLNKELIDKALAEGKRFALQWVPPLVGAVLVDIQDPGMRAVSLIPVIEEGKPKIKGKVYTGWYMYYTKSLHYCGGKPGCPYNKLDYGTGERCWCCKGKNGKRLPWNPVYEEDIQHLDPLLQWDREHPGCYPGLARVEENIIPEEYTEDGKRIRQLADKLASYR